MAEPNDGGKYTCEQKIVSAVWVHERFYNNQSWEDICRNFRYRFDAPCPTRMTLMQWENKLFSQGSIENKEKTGRPVARLIHVPYVKASLEENPNMSLRQRSRDLGLPRSTVLKILQEDLNMVFEVEDGEADPKKRHATYNNGKWKKRRSDAAEHVEVKQEPASSRGDGGDGTEDDRGGDK